MFEIISGFDSFSSVGKLFQTIDITWDKVFDQNMSFLKDLLVSKQDFPYIYLYI